MGVSDKVEVKLTYSATEASNGLGNFEYKVEVHYVGAVVNNKGADQPVHLLFAQLIIFQKKCNCICKLSLNTLHSLSTEVRRKDNFIRCIFDDI